MDVWQSQAFSRQSGQHQLLQDEGTVDGNLKCNYVDISKNITVLLEFILQHIKCHLVNDETTQ